jgi:hypothetical protein
MNGARGMDEYPYFPILRYPEQVKALRWDESTPKGIMLNAYKIQNFGINSEPEQFRGNDP